jgi:regulator of Ty1 transposition protein 103
VLFHRRYADQTAEVWARQFTKVPVNKKLSYLYLANEVVQQSKAKKKEEFVRAFASVLPNALETNYPEFDKEVKARVKRVIDVWKQRQVFSGSVISDMESRITTLDAMSSTSNAGGIFGSIEVPPQLSRLVNLQKQTNNLDAAASDSLKQARTSYDGLFDSEALPAPPVYATKLLGVASKLNYSINTTKSYIVAKNDVCDELRKILAAIEESVAQDDKNLQELEEKMQHTQTTQKEIDELLVEENDTQEKIQQDTLSNENIDNQHEGPIQNTDGIPSYSPLSSDEEEDNADDHRQSKKPKLESTLYSSRDTTPQLDFQSRQDDEYDPTVGTKAEVSQKSTTPPSTSIKDLEGLDPSVAAFLTNLVQGSD